MIRQIINIIMGILYNCMGVFVILQNWFIVDLNPIAAKAFGVLLITYGLFRIFRAAQAIRRKDY